MVGVVGVVLVVVVDSVSVSVDSVSVSVDSVSVSVDSVSVCVGGVTLGGLDGELPPPQCRAFPLLPSLPQLPIFGFPPMPGLSVAVAVLGLAVAVLGLEEPLPSGSAVGPLPGTSFECVPPGTSGEDEGSAMAKAPPRPHRNKPEATTQTEAAPCTREPTSLPPFEATPRRLCRDPSFSHERDQRFAVDLNLLATGTHRRGG